MNKNIIELIKQGESTSLEFKETFDKETVETVGAFANTKGGSVLIGVSDKGKIKYYSTAESALYGKNGNLHKTFDHKRFAEAMRRCKHRWLITYDDSKFIREIFSFANIITWDLTYGMRNVTSNSNQIGKELFISNYLKESKENFKLGRSNIL